MTTDQFAALLAELRSIRSIFFVLALLLGLLVAANLLRGLAQLVRTVRKDALSIEANQHIDAGDYHLLVSTALRALETKPNSAIAHWYLARGYAFQGRNTDALVEFEKTRLLAPGWSEAYIDPQIRALSSESNARP